MTRLFYIPFLFLLLGADATDTPTDSSTTVVVDAASAPPLEACPHPNAISDTIDLLARERMEGAQPILEPYAESCTGNIMYLYALGRLRFLQGRYNDARVALDNALMLDPEVLLRGPIAHYGLLASNTAELVDNFVEFKDPEGRFILLYPPGKDEILLPYIQDAFPKIINRIGQALEYHPDHPIKIEIYAEPADLARATSLTAEEIETSGTIALCKYRKLMLVSPRAMLQGYGWLDTLSHEYVHYAISHKAYGVPIWLHEAYAKYLETRWRSPHSLPMRPTSQDRLRKALRKSSLITFEEMSPSMAKLPSQDHTALAFAEVYTVAQYLDEHVGLEGMRKVLSNIDIGMNDRLALEDVLNTSFRKFFSSWKSHLKKQRWASVPAGLLDKLLFKDRNEPKAQLKVIGHKEAEDFTYIGDMLLARSRPRAASVEYQKAAERTKHSNPLVQSKLARALLDIGENQAALDALLPPLEYYPEHFSLQLNLGRAALRLGRMNQARQALDEALRRNPFDIELHELRAKVAEKSGNTEILTRERAALKSLQDPQ
jgi:tetratricopeptide (TPR) repeat protein